MKKTEQHLLDLFKLVPEKWVKPTSEVLSAAELVLSACRYWEVTPDPALIVGLTDLILQRRSQTQAMDDHGTP